MAGLLRIQITDLFWNIHQGVNLFLVTFFLAILQLAAATADLHWDFLTGRVAYKLARGLLDILEDNIMVVGLSCRGNSPWWCSPTRRLSDTAPVPGHYKPFSVVCSTSEWCSSQPPVYTRAVTGDSYRLQQDTNLKVI